MPAVGRDACESVFELGRFRALEVVEDHVCRPATRKRGRSLLSPVAGGETHIRDRRTVGSRCLGALSDEARLADSGRSGDGHDG